MRNLLLILIVTTFAAACGNNETTDVASRNDGPIVTADSIVLIGQGTTVDDPVAIERFPVNLQTNTAYELTFTAYAISDEAENRLRVDLHPDSLPEKVFTLTNVPTEIVWSDIRSSDPAMLDARLRFFGRFPAGTTIEISNVKLVEYTEPPFSEETE